MGTLSFVGSDGNRLLFLVVTEIGNLVLSLAIPHILVGEGEIC